MFRAAQNGLEEHKRRIEAEVTKPKQQTSRELAQVTWQEKRRKEREEAHADRVAATAAIKAAQINGVKVPKKVPKPEGHVIRSIDDQKWFDAIDTVKLTKKRRPPMLAYKGSVGDGEQDYEAYCAGQGPDLLEWV